MYTIALAYCGTSNDAAIRRLLHVAVSDVSNDVRRAAVLALGFVLLNQPEQCPKLVNLLAESYNPHVRYGAAMAVGISCAGTGLKVRVVLPYRGSQQAHHSLFLTLYRVQLICWSPCWEMAPILCDREP